MSEVFTTTKSGTRNPMIRKIPPGVRIAYGTKRRRRANVRLPLTGGAGGASGATTALTGWSLGRSALGDGQEDGVPLLALLVGRELTTEGDPVLHLRVRPQDRALR